jgi:hypothetical protein
MLEQFILKDKLKEFLEESTVKAALFYSFNFDPRFFENYVMPILVKDSDFGDEVIQNKILWRKYQKEEGRIPPVTVYCDFYAKDNSTAPALGYKIFGIQVPGKKGKICNFHPKHIFLLVEKDKVQSLLFITGSGNLTPGGWCENFEAFSFLKIEKNRVSPRPKTRNGLQDVIFHTSKLAAQEKLTEAENIIDYFLRYVDLSLIYYDSARGSFKDFLIDNVFNKEKIQDIEVISPYFSNDTSLLDFLKKRVERECRFLLPTRRNNEVQISEDLFNELKEAGLLWSNWSEIDRQGEARNIHAKVYRFYGQKKCYTIVGSVNFTKPAWNGYSPSNNENNLESAVLYRENAIAVNPILRPATVGQLEKLAFIEIESLEDNEDLTFKRGAPEVSFTLDWKAKLLSYTAKTMPSGCIFEKILTGQKLYKGSYRKDLSNDDIKTLTGNTLVELSVLNKEKKEFYSFYPLQINIENKPLEFKLSTLNVLDFWNFLEDEHQSTILSRIIAEQITDESGIIHEELADRKSILNEMAAYFNAFIKLERYLFREANSKISKMEQYRDLKYYLLSENIDTVSCFLESLEKDIKNIKFRSLYWMILQILLLNFYEKALRWPHFSVLSPEETNAFRKDIRNEIIILKTKIKPIGETIEGLKEKEAWVLTQLKRNYVS